VPETSRSFHYWQPAPRWRPLPWLANPGNPAMSPHTEGEITGTHHTDKTVERKGGTGEGRQPQRSPHAQKNANVQKNGKTPTKLLQSPMDPRARESWRKHISNRPLTAQVKLVLLVLNSVKLHLTASKTFLKNGEQNDKIKEKGIKQKEPEKEGLKFAFGACPIICNGCHLKVKEKLRYLSFIFK